MAQPHNYDYRFVVYKIYYDINNSLLETHRTVEGVFCRHVYAQDYIQQRGGEEHEHWGYRIFREESIYVNSFIR